METPVCSAILTLCLRLLVLLHVCVLGDRGWCTRLSVLALLGTCTSPAQALVVRVASPTAAVRMSLTPTRVGTATTRRRWRLRAVFWEI